MYEYEIKVQKVIDGDTIDVLFDVGFNMFREERIRLAGIDTPETASKDKREKSMGNEAKIFAAEWLRGKKTLSANTTKDDKYGRILAKIYDEEGKCLNEEMVAKGYAWKYDGGTKIKDLDALLEQRKNVVDQR
jgi:micrococcal nuclease